MDNFAWSSALGAAIDGGGAFLSGYQVYQSTRLHSSALENEEKLHKAEIDMMHLHHAEEIKMAQQTHLISTITDVEEHCQELNENLINGSRESERDMVDQRNQQFFTILLAGTIIFMAIINLLVQGDLSLSSIPKFIVIIFSITIAGSLFFIVLNVILCINVSSKISKFMLQKSRDHRRHLAETMKQTSSMMLEVGISTGRELIAETPLADSSVHSSSDAPISRKRNLAPSHHPLTGTDVDVKYEQHEKYAQKYLDRRRTIAEQAERLATCDTFKTFWVQNCEPIGNTAILFFYLGTSLMLVATMAYMWSEFAYRYRSTTAAGIAVTVLGTSLAACLVLAMYMRYFDPVTTSLRHDVLELQRIQAASDSSNPIVDRRRNLKARNA
jgi:hypothetical protein